MATNDGRSGTGWLAFIVGGLLVAVLVIGYFIYSGGAPQREAELDVDIDTPEIQAPAIPAPDVPEPNLPTPEAPSAPDLPAVPSPAPATPE